MYTTVNTDSNHVHNGILNPSAQAEPVTTTAIKKSLLWRIQFDQADMLASQTEIKAIVKTCPWVKDNQFVPTEPEQFKTLETYWKLEEEVSLLTRRIQRHRNQLRDLHGLLDVVKA
jgi:hypothetical protein